MFEKLTEFQLDAFREIGTIGAGNGATALSQMMNKKIRMTVPSVRILPFAEVPEVVGGAEMVVAGIFNTVSGTAPCNILFLLPLESALVLVDILMGRPVDTTKEIGEFDKSALAEVVNIVGAAYLSALANFTGLEFIPSVPAVAVDMAGAILDVVLINAGAVGDHVLFMETEFSEMEENVTGNFFLLPEEGSLEKILAAIGVKG
ncbi:MAG: chemotaxis protein CheC [Bacillota bacterium]